MKISVELDVFSGRPNPAWELGNQDAKNLNNRLQNLPSLPSSVPAEGLGYRGFMVTLHNEGTVQIVHICAGRVWADADSSKVFIDKNHVEQFLLQMAKERGYGDILKSLGIE